MQFAMIVAFLCIHVINTKLLYYSSSTPDIIKFVFICKFICLYCHNNFSPGIAKRYKCPKFIQKFEMQNITLCNSLLYIQLFYELHIGSRN